jgi:hypothetical protein
MKYVKLVRDFTYVSHDNTILLVKEGTYLSLIENDEEGKTYYRPSFTDENVIKIPKLVIESNCGYFFEVSETEWIRESKYVDIFNSILEKDPYINWSDFVQEIQRRFLSSSKVPLEFEEFLKKIKDSEKNWPIQNPSPIYPTYPLPQLDQSRCPSCGNLKGSPCLSSACPYRIQVWYSSSTKG